MGKLISLEEIAKKERESGKRKGNKILIYGDSGVGKTYYALSSINKRTLLLDVDGSSKWFESYRTKQGLSSANIFPLQIETYKDYLEAIEICKDPIHKLDLVVLDTFSRFQDTTLYQKATPLKPDYDTWGELLRLSQKVTVDMVKIAEGFGMLDVIHTAHEYKSALSPDEDNVNKVELEKQRPDFAGSFKLKYKPRYDFVGRFSIVNKTVTVAGRPTIETKRSIRFGYSNKCHSKTRDDVNVSLIDVDKTPLDQLLELMNLSLPMNEGTKE